VALGAAIKNLRVRNKMSQENLALSAEVDRSYLGRVERGDNNVAVLTLHRIARSLGVSLAELFEQAKL
jgi:transcriptional regulator with XRE-family HTH domain